MDTKKIKAIELTFDWNLWPRQSAQKLDSTNIARMKASLRSGFPLPPVIVNKADLRIVDGFHRTKAYLAVFGDGAEMEVELREYPNEEAMILDAGATNFTHGLPLSPKDRAHFVLKCRRLKIPWPAIASALRIEEKSLKEFIKERTAKTRDGETIALSAGSRNFKGKILTEVQEHYVRTANGCVPEMHISMLINALKADAMILSKRTRKRLQELNDIIELILEEAA